ncbi:hypothetical protein ACOSQ2_033411 [Xanthoceras sorbifolium]
MSIVPQTYLVRASSACLCPPSILIGKKRAVQLRILGPLFPAALLPPSSVGRVRAWSGVYRADGCFLSDLLSVAIGVLSLPSPIARWWENRAVQVPCLEAGWCCDGCRGGGRSGQYGVGGILRCRGFAGE